MSGPVADADEFRRPRCWWRRQEEVAAETAISFSGLLALPLLSNRTAEVARAATCLDGVVRDQIFEPEVEDVLVKVESGR